MRAFQYFGNAILILSCCAAVWLVIMAGFCFSTAHGICQF